ncbi:hypothetical protein DSECCO2_656510 [anaerobic digester metagenome]
MNQKLIEQGGFLPDGRGLLHGRKAFLQRINDGVAQLVEVILQALFLQAFLDLRHRPLPDFLQPFPAGDAVGQTVIFQKVDVFPGNGKQAGLQIFKDRLELEIAPVNFKETADKGCQGIGVDLLAGIDEDGNLVLGHDALQNGAVGIQIPQQNGQVLEAQPVVTDLPDDVPGHQLHFLIGILRPQDPDGGYFARVHFIGIVVEFTFQVSQLGMTLKAAGSAQEDGCFQADALSGSHVHERQVRIHRQSEQALMLLVESFLKSQGDIYIALAQQHFDHFQLTGGEIRELIHIEFTAIEIIGGFEHLNRGVQLVFRVHKVLVELVLVALVEQRHVLQLVPEFAVR